MCGLERKTKVGMHEMMDKNSARFGKKNKSWHAWNDGTKDSVRFGKKNKSWHRTETPCVGCE
jgi:hypothetical protein